MTEPTSVLPLAQVAARRHNTALAMGLLNVFLQHHPQHADAAGVYLLAAKVLAEHRRDDTQAMQILKALIARFPGTASAIEGQTYFTVLERTRVAVPKAYG